MIKADYFICPECGSEVRVGSRGCSRCASDRATKAWDDRKSWEQDESYDGVDLPEEEFDYQAFLDEEFGGGRKKTRLEWLWWATALVLLLAMVGWWMVVSW